MRRPFTYLIVAVLTFIVGLTASIFLRGVLSSSTKEGSNSAVSVAKAPPPQASNATVSGHCGCSQSFDISQIEYNGKSSIEPIKAGVLNGKAISLPQPTYPSIARAAHASGSVIVKVVIDEKGCIESARALNGHPLLQAAAVQAASQACFTPTRLSGQPVKVTGVIDYDFVAE
jgi:TonB family protein